MMRMSDAGGIMRKLVEIEQIIRINGKDVLDTNECALYLNITPCHLRHLAMNKDIPYYKKAGKLYFSKSELDEWRLAERIPTNEEVRQIANKLY